jgi:hypothetical protein
MTREGREVALLLWSCIALFAARVIGQFEALVASPGWLPGMDAWYSGLLPYYLLLPVQIALLMIMAVVAWSRRVRTGRFALARPRVARGLRPGAAVLPGDGAAPRLQRARERRRILARRRDPGGLSLGAGAVPAGQRAPVTRGTDLRAASRG